MTVFKRLAQDFQRLPREFCKLVEEQHSSVGKRHLARYGMGAAAEKTDGTYGVVRCAEWTPRHELSATLGDSGHRVYAGDLQRLIHGEWREYGRNAPSQHRFP